MYPIGYIHARNKLECMGLITEFCITAIMLNGKVNWWKNPVFKISNKRFYVKNKESKVVWISGLSHNVYHINFRKIIF